MPEKVIVFSDMSNSLFGIVGFGLGTFGIGSSLKVMGYIIFVSESEIDVKLLIPYLARYQEFFCSLSIPNTRVGGLLYVGGKVFSWPTQNLLYGVGGS